MTQYRKKHVVEASQWFKDGDHPAVIRKTDPDRYGDEGIPWCPTLEGGHIVTPGDWILTGIQGEHWPVKADIFAATYELAAHAAQEEASEPDYWAVLREDGSGVLVQRDKPDAPEWQRAKPDAADWDAAYPGLAPHTVVPLFLAPAASAPPNLQHVGNRLNVLFDVFLRAGESPAKALELAFDGVKPMFSAASAPRTGEGSAIEGGDSTDRGATR